MELHLLVSIGFPLNLDFGFLSYLVDFGDGGEGKDIGEWSLALQTILISSVVK